METEIVKTENGKDYNKFGEEVITCVICRENKTTMNGTKLCDYCWILQSSIRHRPDLAKKVLKMIEDEKGK